MEHSSTSTLSQAFDKLTLFNVAGETSMKCPNSAPTNEKKMDHANKGVEHPSNKLGIERYKPCQKTLRV